MTVLPAFTLLLTAAAATAGFLAFACLPAHAQQKGWTPAVAPEQAAAAASAATPAAGTGWQTFNVPAFAPGRPPLVLPAVKTLRPAPQTLVTTTGALPEEKPAPHAEAPAPAAAPTRAPVVAAPHPESAKPVAPAATPAKADHAPPMAAPAPAPASSEPSEPARAKAADNLRLAQKYCVNIVDAAADARFSLQKKSLVELQQQLDKRIETLEQKTVEYQKWLARRDEFSKKATENLVKIYAKMSPDAAAAQMAALDLETAAAIVSKLDPRVSSAILNEMSAEKAAALTTTISGAAKVKSDPSSTTPPAGAKKS